MWVRCRRLGKSIRYVFFMKISGQRLCALRKDAAQKDFYQKLYGIYYFFVVGARVP